MYTYKNIIKLCKATYLYQVFIIYNYGLVLRIICTNIIKFASFIIYCFRVYLSFLI